MMPSTHIIIVNYNAGDWLMRSLESALSHSAGKVTIVDNLSSDSSVAKAKGKFIDDRLSWQLNPNNVGFAAANNQVLVDLDADYAVLLNPDCELEKSTLSEILAVMEADQGIGLASCRILNEDGSLQSTCRRRFPTPWSALVRMLHVHKLFPNKPNFANFDYGDEVDVTASVEMVEAISGAFMVARKSAIDEVGLLDEGYFMHCEDLDWCKRFELSAWKVAFVPAAAVTHAKGVSSASRPIGVLLTLHKGMNRFFDKFYKGEYSLALRWFVKFGIFTSFLGRAALALIRK